MKVPIPAFIPVYFKPSE